MSLINDALKKAQRLRAEPLPPGDPLTGAPGPRVEKRSQPMRAQTMILLATAATVLVVFSVVVTVYWLNRPAPVAAHPPTAAARPAIDPAAAKPASPIVVSLPPPPAAAKVASDAPPGVESAPATRADPAPVAAPPPSAAVEKPTVATLPVHEAPPPREIIPAAPPPKPARPVADPRIQQFVDSIRVTGIRSSGSESKVLMNDRVYRLDDLVDRALGVKLVKVEADRLTFVDPNGITYTKSF